ncbi:MAG: SNF2-related protein, partial [Bacteroidales bacterium]|nr:SNF2-related protein [Bacteroidales bacterium]
METYFEIKNIFSILAGYTFLKDLKNRINIIEHLFAVLISQHRHWGTIITPYLISREEDTEYYKPEECLSPYASPETTINLSEEAHEIIDLCNAFSNRNLFRLFSREKNVIDFLNKIDEDRLEKQIKPYIEDKLYKCLLIVSENNLPIYRQKTKSINLHIEDRVEIETEHAIPIFHFKKDNESSSYRLKLEHKNTELRLKGKEIEVISNTPAAIRYEDSIIFINDLNGKKLLPFLEKDEITIPGSHNKKYFSGFVRSIVNQNKVIADGFLIEDHIPVKTARIYLEHGVRNNPGLILKFQYDDIELFSNSAALSFTKLDASSEEYVFKKITRDIEWEKEVMELMVSQGFYTEDGINYTTISSADDTKEEIFSLVEAINNNFESLTSGGIEIETGSVYNNYYLEEYNLVIDYKAEHDWFDLKAFVLVGDVKIPFIKLRKHILDDKREYLLPDGKVLIIPEDWFAKYKSLFELGLVSDELLKIHKQHFSLLNDAFNTDECTSYQGLEKLAIPEIIPEVRPPEGLKIDLRKYQEEGLNWLLFLQKNNLGGCLADDMGLGKTIQTLALLQYNKENSSDVGMEPVKVKKQATLFNNSGTHGSTLLIVPSSLVHNWSNEIKKYTPELSQYIYIGYQRDKNIDYFSDYDIILSTYHTVRQDIAILSTFSFFYIVLDESQLIKNPASQLYKAVARLNSKHRLVLTGTPVENSLSDLWTQLNFVNPGILGSITYFKREFALPIEKLSSEEKEIKLNKLIRPFILRRTKAEVEQDLPPVTELTVWCDMTEEQHSLYDEEKNAIRNTILNSIDYSGNDKSAIMVLQGLMKLRQLSNHPVLASSEYTGSAGKFDTVLEDLRSVVAEGHKILIFSSFVKHLNLFADVLREEGKDFSMLTGRSTNREKIVNEFQSSKKKNIFLISLKAGGVGLNLTAADYVFILDPWWNPAAESQALNRAHRIGQDKNVFVYKYITSGTIEEKIIKLQEKNP